MGLFDHVKELPPFRNLDRKPKRNEVSKKKYLSKNLRRNDVEPLKKLINELSGDLYFWRNPAGFLAVGSSTYPKTYWQERHSRNDEFPDWVDRPGNKEKYMALEGDLLVPCRDIGKVELWDRIPIGKFNTEYDDIDLRIVPWGPIHPETI